MHSFRCECHHRGRSILPAAIYVAYINIHIIYSPVKKCDEIYRGGDELKYTSMKARSWLWTRVSRGVDDTNPELARLQIHRRRDRFYRIFVAEFYQPSIQRRKWNDIEAQQEFITIWTCNWFFFIFRFFPPRMVSRVPMFATFSALTLSRAWYSRRSTFLNNGLIPSRW